MNMEMFIDKLKNSGYEPVQSGTTGVYTFRHRAGNHIIGVMQCTCLLYTSPSPRDRG